MFEARFVAVFKRANYPREILSTIVAQAYEEILAEPPDQEFVDARLKLEAVLRRKDEDGGQIIVSFELVDDLDDNDANTIRGSLLESLSKEPTIEHLCKFGDSLQLEQYRRHAGEIYQVEMRLRQALSFVFMDARCGNYYEFLRGTSVKMAGKQVPKEDDLKVHHENELFFITFDQYTKLNERKLINLDDLIDAIGRATDIPSLHQELTAPPVREESYARFLVDIVVPVNVIEQFRNAIAHNRSYGRDKVQQFEANRARLREAIDTFFSGMAPDPAAQTGTPPLSKLPDQNPGAEPDAS